MPTERLVAGLRCRDVLADLSAYLDGELPEERRERLEAHVRGCDLCTRFGGEFGATVTRLRASLGVAPEPPGSVADRLDAMLESLPARDGT